MRYRSYGGHVVGIVFFTQGFWASTQYRIAHYIHTRVTLQPFRIVLRLWMLFWQKSVEILTGISIPAAARIGHGFYIGHFGTIIIHPDVVIGNNCNIAQGVTIGVSGVEGRRGVPVIGDRVFLGANSVIAGPITVGNDVLVGACSLVNKSVAENAVVQGVPAAVLSNRGSNGYI
ncbi:serine O-acetyltransferase [Flavobacterium magnum]|nr:DapH/DapD/GlmU-related protein [Flavobacterium magnum]